MRGGGSLLFLCILFLLDSILHVSCKRGKSSILEINKQRDGEVTEKLKGRSAIVPVRKESYALKALRNIEILKGRIKSSTDAALSSTGKVQRHFKAYFSSDFEVLLLRMTTPDDSRAEEDDIEQFIGTIETFVRNMDVTSQSNPYRVTLRKIWTKAAESDGLTVLKAQFLLHSILKSTTPEDSLIFKTLLKKMVREKCKKTKSKYFDIAKTSLVSRETKYLRKFIRRYSSYISERAETFTSCFEEMKLIDDGMRTEDICAQMMKAVKILDTALLCKTTIKEEQSDVLLACKELIVRDIYDLFKLFHVKLLWLLEEKKKGDIFLGWDASEVTAILIHLKSFYNDRFEEIETFLFDSAKTLKRRCKIIIPTALQPPISFEDDSIISKHDSELNYPSISFLESSSSDSE